MSHPTVCCLLRNQHVMLSRESGIMWMWMTIILLSILKAGLASGVEDLTMPQFTAESAYHLEFSNSTGAKINCLATRNLPLSVSWSLADGTPVGNVSGLRQLTSDGSLVFSPFLPNIYRQDIHDAVYKCKVMSSDGIVVNKEVSVHAVLDQPFELLVNDVVAVYGSTATLKCIVSPEVNNYIVVIAWIKNNHEKITNSFIDDKRFAMTTSGELFISEVNEADNSSLFHCQAKHLLNGQIKLSTTSGKLVVRESHVTIPAQILNLTQNISVLVGEDVALPCIVQGHPFPSSKWLKISNNSWQSVSFDNRLKANTKALLIRATRREDSGTYICTAENVAGTDKKEISLTLITEDGNDTHMLQDSTRVNSREVKPKILSGFEEMFLQPGEEVNLQCKAIGVPLPHMQWFLEDIPLMKSGRVRIDERKDNGGLVTSTLAIKKLETTDGGVYRCEASSSSGKTAFSTRVNVYGKLIVRPMTQKTVISGENLIATCPFYGYPINKIEWKKESVILPDMFHQTVLPNGTLIVNKVTKGLDDGKYSCVVRNIQGESATGTVDVLVMSE